jgi:hypothetical protein
MVKERFSISIDEDIIKTIASLSNQTGLSKSYIVNKWILEGLKNDNRLSASERYFFSRKIITNCIEGLLMSIGYESKNIDIHNNIIILYLIPSICFRTEKEYNLFRLSIFQVIDSIHIHDTKLHEEIIDSLKELNQKGLKNSEISDFSKLSETSLLPASVPDIINTTISVTELDQHSVTEKEIEK